MGTWNAFYVKAQAQDAAAVSAIRVRFPEATIESSQNFIGVRMPDDAFEAPESKLAELSSGLSTDVIWLGFQSTVDAFQFHHWRAGKHTRALVFGCFEEERTWERVEGEAESWERDVFFGQGDLSLALKCAGSVSERQEIERTWRAAEILTGQTLPSLDSRAWAHKIAALYDFPGYSR